MITKSFEILINDIFNAMFSTNDLMWLPFVGEYHLNDMETFWLHALWIAQSVDFHISTSFKKNWKHGSKFTTWKMPISYSAYHQRRENFSMIFEFSESIYRSGILRNTQRKTEPPEAGHSKGSPWTTLHYAGPAFCNTHGPGYQPGTSWKYAMMFVWLDGHMLCSRISFQE